MRELEFPKLLKTDYSNYQLLETSVIIVTISWHVKTTVDTGISGILNNSVRFLTYKNSCNNGLHNS